MTLTYQGEDLFWLIAYFVISVPCTIYCMNHFGDRFVRFITSRGDKRLRKMELEFLNKMAQRKKEIDLEQKRTRPETL